MIEFLTSAQLDLALGRPNVIHAALLAGPASDTFLARFRRLERFRTGDRREQAAEPTEAEPAETIGCVWNWTRMTETTKNSGEKLSVTPTKTLTLKRGASSRAWCARASAMAAARRSSSRRSSAASPVRARPRPNPPRRRIAAPRQSALRAAGQSAAAAPAPAAAPAAAPKASGVVLRTLTEDERNARAHALADARLREAEERKIAEEEAASAARREEAERAERAAAEARKRDEEDRRKHDEETKRKADEVAKKRFGAET